MTLSEKLKSGEFVYTAEITPPKGAGVKKLLEHAHAIGPLMAAVNVTDGQRALVKMSSLAASKVLLDAGYDPVYQLTCRDRNSIALQSDLMGAGALGIQNVLCLTGDPVKAGDHPHAKSVFEVEAIGLLNLVRKLQSGTDFGGNKMNKGTKFHVGAVVNPTLSAGNQLERMGKKKEAGAVFFQTQANYDPEDFAKFLQAAKPMGTKVLAGILLLHSKEIAHYLKDNITGIRFPDSMISDFDKVQGEEAEENFGIDWALRTMETVRPYCDGFHLMTVRYEEVIPKWMARWNANNKEVHP